MNIARWSVENRVAVNLLAIAVLVGGFLAAGLRLQRDIFPDVSTNFIRITTPDATTSLPEDIEQLITVPIEEELSGITGLVDLISFSQDNISTIFLEIDPAIDDLDPVLNEVRQQVSIARTNLPPSAEESVIESFDIPLPLLTFGIMTPPGFDLTAERAVFDRLERELTVVPGVSEVLVAGLTDREVWVEVDPYRAQLVGLGLAGITQSVSASSRDWTGGRITTQSGEQVVRFAGQIRAPEDLEHLRIPSPSGIVRLRDFATFKETQEEISWRGRINLHSGLTFTIIKRRGADAMETAEEAARVFHEIMDQAPEGVEGFVVSDSTKYIDIRIRTVVQNGIQALVIVTVLLVMLLNWRVALLIAYGLPISIAGTFLVLYWRGDTLNLLSLFAMIMAIGMIVDDALVIAENAYRYYESGLSRFEAAIRGTQEVIWPVIGSVSTTVAAFLPLILGEGIIGRFLAVVPIVVISGLAFSLVEAFVVLPSHMADFTRPPVTVRELERKLAESTRPWKKIYFYISLAYIELRNAVDRILAGVIDVYTHLLVICLRRRYFVGLGFVILLMAGGAAGAFGLLRFQLFATDFADQILVKVDLPANYSLDQTEEVVTRLEQAIVDELPADEVVALVTQVGSRLEETNQFIHYGTNLAMITVDIDDENPKARRPSRIERQLQQILNRFPELVTATAAAQGGGPPVGLPINIQIRGDSFDVLRQISAEMRARLAEVPGVVNLADDFVRGKPEYVYRLDKERAAEAGLSGDDIGRALQGVYRGLEAARVRWGNDEVRIRVLVDERFRDDPELLAGLRILAPDGRMIPLHTVTTLERTSGIARIARLDQQRMISVTGDVDTRAVTATEIQKLITPWLAEMEETYPGYRLTITGESEDTEKSINSMTRAGFVAILLIYVILAVIFNSFLQPVMIMAVIPFGIIGVLGGLLLMNEPLGLMAIMGTIALAGIVVNNSVVFVDFINRFRRENPLDYATTLTNFATRVRRWRSIIVSGRIRFRPIFLTSATTIGGLFSLAFMTTGQEEFLAPMAQAIVFGLLFASLITMVLIPCLYAIIDDIMFFNARIVQRLRGRAKPGLPPNPR